MTYVGKLVNLNIDNILVKFKLPHIHTYSHMTHTHSLIFMHDSYNIHPKIFVFIGQNPGPGEQNCKCKNVEFFVRKSYSFAHIHA